ncbi:hypothetical protein J3R82DRAFT_6217 [Butyriboletus roseoflavus]|nr:hypothetical protein J3R82DRAFT_6217 [Butyriboletus roseoflavus]
MTGMSKQCSTNLGSVKHAGLTYVLSNHEVLEPPIQKREDKSGRGFNHSQIAWMLCPRKKLISFDKDPDMMIRALQEGLIKMTASNWPTCFYKDSIYDPENKAKAVETDTIISNTSKMSKNHAWGLIKVTPSIIAYAHVMLYFTLSTAPCWCSNVGLMDLSEMT